MNNNLLKHPRFLLKNEIDMKLIYKSMIFRSNYSIRAINLNTSTFYLSRTDIVKIIFRVNGSFRYKSLTAHKAITYFDYIMHNNNIEKNNIPLIALCCYILSAKFCENDPTIPEESKFIEVFTKFSNFQYNFTVNDVYKWEVFCIKKLNYDLIRYTLYDFLHFYFVNGILLVNDVQTLTNSERIKKLEKIYNKAREVIDYIMTNEGDFCFKKKNYVIAKNILKFAMEDVLGKGNYINVVDIIYNEAYDDNSERGLEEIQTKVKQFYKKVNSKSLTEQKIMNINIQVGKKVSSKRKKCLLISNDQVMWPTEKNKKRIQYKIINIIKLSRTSRNKDNVSKIDRSKNEMKNIIYVKPSIETEFYKRSVSNDTIDNSKLVHSYAPSSKEKMKTYCQSNLINFSQSKPIYGQYEKYRPGSIDFFQTTSYTNYNTNISNYQYNSLDTLSTLSPTSKKNNNDLLEKTIQLFGGCFSEEKSRYKNNRNLSLYEHHFEHSQSTRHLYHSRGLCDQLW